MATATAVYCDDVFVLQLMGFVFRDTVYHEQGFLQLIRSVTIALFWLSGIIFNMSGVHNPILRVVLLINPITTVVNGFRNSLIYKQWFWEDWPALIAFVVVYAIMTGLAVFVYKRLKNDVADVL